MPFQWQLWQMFSFLIFFKNNKIWCENKLFMIIWHCQSQLKNLDSSRIWTHTFRIPVWLVSQMCKFKCHFSQHFSVDFSSVRLSWKVSVHVNLWGWFWNDAKTFKGFSAGNYDKRVTALNCCCQTWSWQHFPVLRQQKCEAMSCSLYKLSDMIQA